MKGHGSMNHDWLHGVKNKPVRKDCIPRDMVLDFWKMGISARNIQESVRRADGSKYSVDAINHVIQHAREEGDPRAIYRRKPKNKG